MSDLYTEVMVAKKPTVKDQLIKFVLILFTVLFALAGLVLMPILLVAAVILGVVDYVFIPRLSVEFEYLYVNGELDVDRIFSKSRRKRAASYDLSSMEIMAPWNSHRLDSYKNNRGLKKVDYSSGIEGEGRHQNFCGRNAPTAQARRAATTTPPRRMRLKRHNRSQNPASGPESRISTTPKTSMTNPTANPHLSPRT